MKYRYLKLIIIALPICLGCICGSDSAPSLKAPLIVFVGESNSGGAADNLDADSTELDEYENILILNNDNFEWEKLHIGVNNRIGHSGGTCCPIHGWELELGNKAESGCIVPIRLLKAGQGGSKLSQWIPGGTFMNVFSTRWDAATDSIDYEPYIFISMGINDALDVGFDSTTFADDFVTWVSDIRAVMGSNAPIAATRFDENIPNKAVVNNVLDALEGVITNFVAVDQTGATMGDVNHWDYEGLKTLTPRMLDAVGIEQCP